MSLLDGRKAYKALQDGIKYHVILTGYEEHERADDTKTDRDLGFIVFKGTLIEDGRPYSDTRNVPVGTDIMARQLLAQLNAAKQLTDKTAELNGIDQVALFNECIKNKTQLEVWITHNDEYTNFTYQEPIKQQAAAVDNEDFK